MNQELSGKLVEVIGAIQSSVGKASDFAVEQLPDIAQQYIAYGRVSATALCLFGLVAAVYFAYACVINIEKAQKASYSSDLAPTLTSVVCGAASFLSAIIIITNLDRFFLVWFAPKIYLIKGLAELIK